MDVITLMVLGFGSAAGYKRGLVLEITDWCIGLFAGMISLRGYRPMGAFVHRQIKGWPDYTCDNVSFWFLLLFFGIMILSAGLHVDRVMRENDRLPEEVRKYGGLAVAFVKCLIISSLLCAYLPYSDGITASERHGVKNSASAQALRGLAGPIGVLVSVVAPQDIAVKYRDAVK